MNEHYQPSIGETVSALGNSGKDYTGSFKRHTSLVQSVIVQPGGARIYVQRATLRPFKESK